MKLPRFRSAKSMFARVPDFYAILQAGTAPFWGRLRKRTNSIFAAVGYDPSNPFTRYLHCIVAGTKRSFVFRGVNYIIFIYYIIPYYFFKKNVIYFILYLL